MNVDEGLLARAKQAALDRHCTLGEIIDDALRAKFFRQRSPASDRKPTRLPTFRGTGLQPGIDLDSTSDLLERMDGQ